MSDEGYFTIIGGDLDGQHRYIGEDATELHHIPKQEIPADTHVEGDCVNPTWTQEKYTRRDILVNGEKIEFFGLASWENEECVRHLFFAYTRDRGHDDRKEAIDG